MYFFALTVAIFLFTFVVLPVICFCTRIKSNSLERLCPQGYRRFRQRYTQQNIRQQAADRQGNIFTIADESANNSLQHRCPDFFYVEPSAEDAARIRAQLEKDEKDLPTYEEVMAMSTAQAQTGSMAPHNESNTSIVTTPNTTLPPYSEVNTSVSRPTQTPVVTNGSNTNAAMPLQHAGAAVWPMTTNPITGSGAASTSRAAAAAATNTLTTMTIANSVSNTSV